MQYNKSEISQVWQKQGLQAPDIPAPPPLQLSLIQHKQAQQPAQPAQQEPQPAKGQQVVHLNWLYFKPEFSGKPEEDAEAHLLQTNDWMNAHHF